MENSFFEFRDNTLDETGLGSDSEEDNVINDSVIDKSFSIIKKPTIKNKTVFIAESDDYTSDEDENDKNSGNVQRRSRQLVQKKIISSDDDSSSKVSTRRGTNTHFVIESSSDDNDVSPEMVPRRPPSAKMSKNRKSSESPLIRRVKRRIVITDSETDNSFSLDRSIKGHCKKQQCQQDTPLVFKNKNARDKINQMNVSIENCTETSDESEDGNEDASAAAEDVDTDEYGPDEFEMTMSRATRMSIMGPRPQTDDDSDHSDLIHSDHSNRDSRQELRGSLNSINSLPDAGIIQNENTKESPQQHHTKHDSKPSTDDETNENVTNLEEDDPNDSKISCSTFGSPGNVSSDSSVHISESPARVKPKMKIKREMIDEEVRIVDEPVEVIDLSSGTDSEPEESGKKSPRKTTRKSKSPIPRAKSPKNSGGLDIHPTTSYESGLLEPGRAQESSIPDMKRYLQPASYPNAGVVYVKQKIKEQETLKLNKLRTELQNAKLLLDTMDVSSLPDGGVKLMLRLSALEQDVHGQAEKVANMVVHAEENTEPSWEELQKASHRVQPRQFGKQAMATHMAERDLILSRLHALCESLKSRPADSAEGAPPNGLRSTLMPHQLQALSWLRWRETQHPRGGILADDMGLGKTITMISLVLGDKEARTNRISDDEEEDPWLEKEKAKLVRGGTLVVCPASLVQQWEGEVRRHCVGGALSVKAHHGASRDTRPLDIARYHLLITTYNLLQRDREKNGPLFRVRWSRVILDEAHVVRNHKSATSGAVSALVGRARWCLTGTPVQNKDLDVFALIKFLKCTPFDELTMWKKWIDNKSEGGQERMSTIMRCLLLRRTKAQLQEKGQLNCLPERTLHQIPVTLTTEEMNVYQKVLVFSKTLFAQFLHQRAEKQADFAGFGSTAKKNDPFDKMHKRMVALHGAKPVKSHEILVLLLRLRQVCCHCGLIAAMLDGDEAAAPDQGSVDLLHELNKMTLEDKQDGGLNQTGDEELVAEDAVSVDEAIKSVLSVNNPVFQLSRLSSKIRVVLDTLTEHVFNKTDEKAVVVSQWTSVLSLVKAELDRQRVKSVTLSGQVPVPARPALIDAVNDPNSNVKVMLLSLCAGGVGLNLCGANHLLLLDPHWNPQLEEQAQDRIYRVGQNRHVHIYRFMCLDTVEQSIRNLQQAKLALAESVLTGARNANISKLSIEDLKMLFNMGGS